MHISIIIAYFFLNGAFTVVALQDEFAPSWNSFVEYFKSQPWYSKLLMVLLPFLGTIFFVVVTIFIFLENFITEYRLKTWWRWHFNRKKLKIEDEQSLELLKNRYNNLKAKRESLAPIKKRELKFIKKILEYNGVKFKGEEVVND